MTDGHEPQRPGTDPREAVDEHAGVAPAPDDTGPADTPPDVDADEGAGRDLVEVDPRSRDELVAELAEAEARRDEYLEDVRRARAEFENYRKRVMREGAAQRDAGRAEVAGALVEVLDDLDRTLEAAAGSGDEQLATGVQLVADKLVRALDGVGLERIDATGVPFDPTQHEAVQHRPAEAADDGPIVVEVLRPGYRMGSRMIRAAMVVVEG